MTTSAFPYAAMQHVARLILISIDQLSEYDQPLSAFPRDTD